MTSCRLQSNYSSTVTLRGGPVRLRFVRATPCLVKIGMMDCRLNNASKTLDDLPTDRMYQLTRMLQSMKMRDYFTGILSMIFLIGAAI